MFVIPCVYFMRILRVFLLEKVLNFHLRRIPEAQTTLLLLMSTYFMSDNASGLRSRKKEDMRGARTLFSGVFSAQNALTRRCSPGRRP